MASKYTIDRDTGAVVVHGWRHDGLAMVCKTETEAKQYIASRRGKDAWAAFAIIKRASRYGEFEVVVRQR